MLKDLCYTSNESLFYTYLLNENGFNSINDSISGANVVKLFLKSKLDKFTLKKIWDLASERKAPDLNKLEFFCACRLVALSQRGEVLNKENAVNLNYKDIMPKFEGVFFDKNKKISNNVMNNNSNNKSDNMFQYNNLVWGLGPSPNPQSPIPNPQSPIPNPQSPSINVKLKNEKLINGIMFK